MSLERKWDVDADGNPMTKVSGYILVLPKDRIEEFVRCVDEGRRFGEPVPEFPHSRTSPLVCFVVDGRNISHIAIGRLGNISGTALRRLNLETSEKVTPSISVQRLVRHCPNRNKSYINRRFVSGGLLSEKGFSAIDAAIRQLAPQLSAILDRFGKERGELVNRLPAQVKENLAYQKQAVMTAMLIAGIDRKVVREWTAPDETPISFLDGLPAARLREDPMVIHDLMCLPGFDLIKTLPYSAAVFKSKRERLTIILANRQPLETQTGTDLIYFNETHQSFVMVQYKAMETERGDDGASNVVFRLPNAQLTAETERMGALLNTLRACDPNSECNGFRLTDNPFFLKLCPRLVFNPDDIGLVPGMYLPLDYWGLLEQHPGICGPRGGRGVTYQNVGRYFDNTAFAALVAKAWIGTTPSQSALLKEAIRQTLETGRAIAIAIKPTNNDCPAE